ncbi:MAG: 4-hydroxythreonine-4-phosphate dehydrogenase PdxA [Hyphomicrobiales bacterium]
MLTPGEPGGVGPEIAAKAWQALRGDASCTFAWLGDADHLHARAKAAGAEVPVVRVSTLAEATAQFPVALPVLQRALPAAPVTGQFSATTAPWVMAAITEAVELCLSGAASAMVTCPIQKEALYAAGFKHQGHTDFLAHLCHARGLAAQEVMMLVGGGLRAVPITVHIPLKDVPTALTAASIEAQALVVHAALRRHFGIAVPRLAFTGLNPHAGENGTMGTEEKTIIIPALMRLKAAGIAVTGPLPADTAFLPEARSGYDAILCMYHDQALIPVKTLDMHGGVNVTLGLPFIRTSPDHGTALGLAGTGKARPDSLITAIRLAADMAAQTA